MAHLPAFKAFSQPDVRGSRHDSMHTSIQVGTLILSIWRALRSLSAWGGGGGGCGVEAG